MFPPVVANSMFGCIATFGSSFTPKKNTASIVLTNVGVLIIRCSHICCKLGMKHENRMLTFEVESYILLPQHSCVCKCSLFPSLAVAFCVVPLEVQYATDNESIYLMQYYTS